jgi:hypothetical protein
LEHFIDAHGHPLCLTCTVELLGCEHRFVNPLARAEYATSVERVHQLVLAHRHHDRPDMQMHDTTTPTASNVIPVHYVINILQIDHSKDTEQLQEKNQAWHCLE